MSKFTTRLKELGFKFETVDDAVFRSLYGEEYEVGVYQFASLPFIFMEATNDEDEEINIWHEKNDETTRITTIKSLDAVKKIIRADIEAKLQMFFSFSNAIEMLSEDAEQLKSLMDFVENDFKDNL